MAVTAQKVTGQRPKLLAVDDDPDLLRLIELVFLRAGYDVIVAADGEAALGLIEDEGPDVLLLDLMMPAMDGFSVLQWLRRRVDSPRVVCLTAKGGRMDRERAWRLGVDEYVTKPFSLSAVLGAADAVVGRSWPERRARRWRALTELGTLP